MDWCNDCKYRDIKEPGTIVKWRCLYCWEYAAGRPPTYYCKEKELTEHECNGNTEECGRD
nr:MAG TPA: hypothetical protein [Caudoviricetes sp.]